MERFTLMKKTLLFLYMALLAASPAMASKEGVLPLREFKVESKIPKSDSVVVSGKQNDKNEIKELKVEAFGNNYELKDDDLKKIPQFAYNGIQLSYEENFIYVTLQFGFSTGNKQRVMITVTKKGDVKVEQLK